VADRWWLFWRRSPPVPPAPRVVDHVFTVRRAERLLLAGLTAAQRREYPLGYFDVTGSRGGRYRIHTHSSVQNITQLSIRGDLEFCVGLPGVHHRQEVLYAQKILIEADEGRFLREAVPSVRRRRYQVTTPYQVW